MSAPSVLEQAGLVARLDLVRRLRDRSVLIQVFLAPVFLALIFGGGAGGIQAEIWLADADEAGAVVVIPTRFGEAVESGARAELVVVRGSASASPSARSMARRSPATSLCCRLFRVRQARSASSGRTSASVEFSQMPAQLAQRLLLSAALSSAGTGAVNDTSLGARCQ
jgi:hypothetical protein